MMCNDQRRTIFTRWRSLALVESLSKAFDKLTTRLHFIFLPALSITSEQARDPGKSGNDTQGQDTNEISNENPTLWKHIARLRLRRNLVVLSIYSFHRNKACCCCFFLTLSLSLSLSLPKLLNFVDDRYDGSAEICFEIGHKHNAFCFL